MIIKAKPIPIFLIKWFAFLVTAIFRRRFNKMVIRGVEIRPAHSYLLMSNHFSFLDGILAIYLCLHEIDKRQKVKGFYIMVLKKQMQKNWWLKYIGCFSVAPGSPSVGESLNYAAEVLETPGNLLLFYPQGNLESLHVRHIEFKDGVSDIISRVKNNCQLIWTSTLIEYFESIKPSVYFNMLDCGTNHEFDAEQLKKRVNTHHRHAIESMIRFTKEPMADNHTV